MYVLMAFIITCIVYILAFKDDFTAEHINKITPFMVIMTLLIVLLNILSMVTGR